MTSTNMSQYLSRFEFQSIGIKVSNASAMSGWNSSEIVFLRWFCNLLRIFADLMIQVFAAGHAHADKYALRCSKYGNHVASTICVRRRQALGCPKRMYVNELHGRKPRVASRLARVFFPCFSKSNDCSGSMPRAWFNVLPTRVEIYDHQTIISRKCCLKRNSWHHLFFEAQLLQRAFCCCCCCWWWWWCCCCT